MKAKEKKKHCENEEKKDEDNVLQEQPNMKPRKNRFLACLQNAWAKMTGRKVRKTSSQVERGDLPGPSNIHQMDGGTGKPKIKAEEADTPDGQEIRWAIQSFVEKVIKQACHQIYVEQDMLEENHQMYDQIQSFVEKVIQQACKQVYMEKVIQDEQHQMCDHISNMDDVCARHYEGQDEDIKNEDHHQETDKEGLEKTDKAEKRKNITFLARLQKSWAWISKLKRRGSHVINEGELSESTTTSESSRCHEEKSNKSDISSEEPGTSKITPAAKVPLSLQSFTFHRKLGKGTFGHVYLATDIIRKEQVAIKVADKRVFRKLGHTFVERHVLQISHENPYLIHGLATFHTTNFLYYVMEVATRGDLKAFLLKYGPCDITTVKFIAAELVCGIEFLHKKGIVHRDLKPLNILLSKEGHMKITDFGLAMTDVFYHRAWGTLGYAPPEMVKGEAYGKEVDYFALGVILYKLFTLKSPFPGRDKKQVILSVLKHTPVYPESLTPETVNILEGLLCKDQFQRLGFNGDIRRHQFFSGVNWEEVEAQRMLPPPILMEGSVDFKVDQTLDYAESSTSTRIKTKEQKIFDEFNFICPEWSKNYYPVINQPKNWISRLFCKRSSR